MTLKLSELLFEEQNPKKLHRLFEEAEGDQKGQESEDNKKSEFKKGAPVGDKPKVVGKKDFALTAKKIANKLDTAIPKPKDLLADTNLAEQQMYLPIHPNTFSNLLNQPMIFD